LRCRGSAPLFVTCSWNRKGGTGFAKLSEGKNSARKQSADGFASRWVDAGTAAGEKSLPDRLLVQEESRAVFRPVKEISWVEADRNYVLLHAGIKTHTLPQTLEPVQNSIRPKLFVPGRRGRRWRGRCCTIRGDRKRLRRRRFRCPVEIQTTCGGPSSHSVASFPLVGYHSFHENQYFDCTA